jgi:hypothetical protein
MVGLRRHPTRTATRICLSQTGHDAANYAVATVSLGVFCESMTVEVKKLTAEEIDYTIQPVTIYRNSPQS